MNIKISIGESNHGCDHFKLGFISREDSIQVEILAADHSEKRVLREHLFLEGNQQVVFENDKAIIPLDANLYFDGKQIAKCQNGSCEFQKVTLPEIRMIAEYNDTKTSKESFFYNQLSSTATENKSYKRIDGHTHYVAAFAMKTALEKSMKINETVYIPNLVVLKILKDKGMLNAQNRDEWMAFIQNNQVLSNDEKFKQKDASDDLITEDFVSEIPRLSDEEKEVCLHENKAYYTNLETLKSEFTEEEWGEFCNGFDLPATHSCDFTEHMEMVYNLRNWFGKDTTFLQAQLEEIYEAYEAQGIDYAEIPAGFFKKQNELDKFIEMNEQIEKRRAVEGKQNIILRPGLSIARLLEATFFRKTLFSYIPLIEKNPEIASITVLAHETNPTTEHLIAIRDFTRIINTIRPGFTVEVHAGETSAYGEINMSEARALAYHNRLVVIRAGHASYGDHVSQSTDNFFEEKCPLSNVTLIDIEPEIHVNVLLGIAEGKTNMFWGSDGAIYNPLYSPEKQERFFMQLMGHSVIEQELERRWNEGQIINQFGANSFKSYQENLAKELNNQLDRNKKNEDNYINFKHCEKEYHQLKINITKLKVIAEIFEDVDDLEDKINADFLSESELVRINELIDSHQKMQRSIPLTSFADFQTFLLKNSALVKDLNEKTKPLLEKLIIFDKPFIDDVSYQFLLEESLPLANRSSVEFYYKLRQIMPLSLDQFMSNAPMKLELDFLSNILDGDIMNDLITQLKKQWNSQNGKPTFLYYVNDKMDENNISYIYIQNLFNKIVTINKSIYNAYDQLSACLSEKTTTGNRGILEQEASKLEYTLKNNIDYFLTSFIEKMPMPEDPTPIAYCELYLDPAYHYNQVAKSYHEKNIKELSSNESDRNLSLENFLVLFGSPEQCSNQKLQQNYMNNLYKNIYSYVSLHRDNGIILLGNVLEGINPLVYKIIEDHPDVFANVPIYHVVTTDENINNMKRDTEHVSYFIAGKSRQECHIAYADFIQKNNLSNIIMFGGKTAIWADTKNALAERKLQNNETLGQKIKFYTDGFETARSSSAFAKGVPQQCCKHQQPNVAPLNELDLLHPKFYEQYPKTASYHRNLGYAFQSIIDLFEFSKVSTEMFEMKHFLAAYNPTYSAQFKDYTSVVLPEEGQEQIKAFFTNFFDSDQATPAIVIRLNQILSEDGYGVARDMERNFPSFSLSEQIQLCLQKQDSYQTNLAF